MKPRTHTSALSCISCVLGVGLLACTPTDQNDDPPPTSGDDARITEAQVELSVTEGREVSGTLRLTVADGGLELTGTLQGLPPESVHAAHVHVNGDCSAPDASSAGPHFNFQDPGSPTPDATRIVGNLGEFTSGSEGSSNESRMVSGAALNGPASIVGRAVVIHESGNEPGPPAGSQSGARVACGVVGITGVADDI